MPGLTEHDIDRLALHSCELIGFESGHTVAYGTAAYDRIERIQVKPGSLQPRDAAPQPAAGALPPQAKVTAGSYPSRLAGFVRRDIFGPDEIGRMLGERSVAFNDGLGNGLYESLRIDRKYGLHHVLEAPVMGFHFPYLPQDWPAFREVYAAEVERFLTDLRELEPVYGAPLASPGAWERWIVLWCPYYPLSLFAQAYFDNPAAVEDDLERELGVRRPPVSPSSPPERAVLARFLALVRRRQGELSRYQAGVLRRAMGAGLKVIANPHELPPLDMELQGEAFDYPAVAIRPLLVDDEVHLRHYIAYYTQFTRDLTGKPPMVSVRMNLSAASPRFVPRPGLIRQWYDQAVRHGAGAFYFWTRDYPYADDPAVYDGSMPGNPDPSALGRERWQTVIEQLGWLAGRRRFEPPAAEIAILVPNESALMFRQDWRRVYAAFSAFAERRIQAGFISDRKAAAGGIPQGVKLLAVPVLVFVSPALRRSLEAFIARGGTLLLVDAPLYDESGRPAPGIAGARPLAPALLEVFPLERSARLPDLECLADTLAAETARSGADVHAWVFDVTCANLPPSDHQLLRPSEPGLRFDPWLYEHGSPWITPYIKK